MAGQRAREVARELAHLMEGVRVRIKRGLPAFKVGSLQFGELKEGDVVELPRWVAEVLSSLGFVETEEAFEIELFKALSRERIQGTRQLSPLPKDFYVRLRRLLRDVRKRAEEDSSQKTYYDKLHSSAYDLISLRLQKLLTLACSSAPAPELSERIAPEELELFETVHKAVDDWRRRMVEG